MITKRLIQEGTVFDLNQIDLLNMFRYSPLDTSSSALAFNPRRNYYYFGCTPEDGINYIDDLKDARDFNAVLWYAKNTQERLGAGRECGVGKNRRIEGVQGHNQ